MEAWIYPTTFSGTPYIVDFRPSGSNGAYLTMYINTSGNLIYYVNTAVLITSSVALVTNVWSHVAIVRSGTSTLTMYINGASVGTATDSTNYAYSTPNIGRSSNSATGYFPGNITSVKYTCGTALYTSSFTPQTSTPILSSPQTHMMVNGGNNLSGDFAGLSNVVFNGTITTQTSTIKLSNGVNKGALTFDGSTGYISSPVTNQQPLGGANWTIEAWVYATSFSGTPYIIDYRPSGGNGIYPTLYVNTSGNVIYYVNSAVVITSSSALSTSTWYYIALVKNGSTTTLYINGTSNGTYSDSNVYLLGTFAPFIGRSGNSATGYWPGSMQEIRITKGIARTISSTAPAGIFPVA
jgi:hypothetical protein